MNELPVGAKLIPGLNGYAVTESGEVLSCLGNGRFAKKNAPVTHQWKRRKLVIGPEGYLRVWIYGKVFNVHALMLLTFVGPRPEGFEGCHCNSDKLDNHRNNLRYDTHKGNLRDRDENGTTVRGTDSHLSKLQEADVLEIRRRFGEGESQGSLAKAFSVNQGTIHCVVKRKTWKHI